MTKQSDPTKAHQRYRNLKGQIVPGVTTVLGVHAKPQLVPWAWKLGMEGKDYRKVTGIAAEIGTVAHYLVECFLKGQDPDLTWYSQMVIERAQVAFQNFKGWWEAEHLTAIAVEARLVSEVMQCGGTVDCVAEKYYAPPRLETIDLWLVDVKTSKGIYAEHLYQLAAYWAMWNETHAERLLRNAHIVHLSKETGNLSHHRYNNLFTELEIFRLLRAVYGLEKDKDPKRNLDRLYTKFNLERL